MNKFCRQSVSVGKMNATPLFSPVVDVGVVIVITSKYMFIIIAENVTAVSKIPAKTNQVFNRLFLRLSAVSFAVEFLQLQSKEYKNTRMFILTQIGRIVSKR